MDKLTRNQGREFFEGLDYQDILESDIYYLVEILKSELKEYRNTTKHAQEMGLKVSKIRKKDIKVLKRTGLKYAQIQIDGSYFERREGITFSITGFIGFAVEMDDKNIQPILRAFQKWCICMKERKNMAICS